MGPQRRVTDEGFSVPTDIEDPRGWRDPTARTLETVHREVATVKESFCRDLQSLRELTDEKFRSETEQRNLIEARRVEQKEDTKIAVDAALAAQKEAVQEQTRASGLSISKSEAATMKSLEQLNGNFATAIAAVTSNLNDLKERVVAMEFRGRGGATEVSNHRQDMAVYIAGVSALVAIIAVIVTVIIAFRG